MTATERSLVQAELKQSKPFRNIEQEAYLAIQRTADELQSRATEVLKPFGISPTQFNVLRILRGAEPKGHKCGEIGDRMVKRDPDITRLLDRMERSGLITRSRDVRDRRVVVTRITQKGLDILRKLDRPIDDLGRDLLGHVGERRLKILIKLLDEVRTGRK